MGTYDWVAEAFFGKPAPEEGAEGTTAPSGTASAGPAAVFVVFDLETTGLEPKRERIVEIGAVKFDRRGPIGRFSVLIDPGIPMPAKASEINGITDAMLAGQPGIDLVLPDFLRFAGDAPLIAHNASFDCSFVNAALSERWERAKKAAAEDASQGSLLDAADAEGPGGAASGKEAFFAPPYPALPNRIIDTLVYAKETFPGRWKYSLQELAKYFGINALDAHRAEDDARVCMEVFIKCAEKAAGREVRTFN